MDALSLDPLKNDLMILVDGLDRPQGTATKERVHREGLLHRAFSAVLVREDPEGALFLLTRRAREKYHAGGLWANACCSHPRPEEELFSAVRRRVREELGCGCADLREVGCFLYRAEFPNGLCEFEMDHVVLGRIEGPLQPDPREVCETRFLTREALAALLRDAPGRFAPWAFPVLSIAMRA